MTEPVTSLQGAMYEARHREMREAVTRLRVAWQAGELDGSSLIAADNLLDSFRIRTAEPVDAVMAAARGLFDVFDPDDGSLEKPQYDALRLLFARIGALDEAACG